MTKVRTKIFGDAPDLDLDLTAFTPKTGPLPSALPPEDVRAVAEAAKFPSRQAKPREAAAVVPVATVPAATPRPPRRLRTGRTEQLNARASAQTIADFYAIADRHGWKAAETLERAVAALKRETEGQGRAGA